MSRYKLYIEYDGTRYSGWQMQKDSKTIQGTLLSVAEEIFDSNNKIELMGSGRTDAGVHAIEQIAHMEVKTMLAPEIIRLKMNDKLPHDIHLLEVEKTNPKFHARHDAKMRSYVYQISKRRTAFGKNYVWWIKDKLNFEAMKKTSIEFVGMHDFVSFTDDDKTEKSTKVLVKDIELKETSELILIRIKASHFLWKQVRRIIGVLVEVGRGNLNEKNIIQFLKTYSDVPAKYTAPPSGLFLEKVIYHNEKIGELKPVLLLNKE
ncbi:MAG: tRNA pseudouridine(38-40) synthase TruA [Chlorobiaceae bacterium]|nr:tRNA pseudouridine(38-40) synthase TruA [Chlorobiaceae bacterium]